MSWASTYPAAIAGLLAALGRSQALAGVKVTRGLGISDPDADDVIAVGFSGSPADESVATGNIAREGAGLRNREQYGVSGVVIVTSGDEGDEGLAAAEERAFALLAAAGGAISVDPQLGKTVMGAFISSWSLNSGQVSDGVRAEVRFSVSIDAFTR